MQAAELGRPLDWQGADTLARGDLVFWDGHVGIMASGSDLLHASAHHMAVVVEPFAEAEPASPHPAAMSWAFGDYRR